MSIDQLEDIAQAMVAPGKGIIAIDESNATCKKRFDAVGIECTEENRRAYRELLLTAPKLSDHIAGAILFDETLRRSLPPETAEAWSQLAHRIGAGLRMGVEDLRERMPGPPVLR